MKVVEAVGRIAHCLGTKSGLEDPRGGSGGVAQQVNTLCPALSIRDPSCQQSLTDGRPWGWMKCDHQYREREKADYGRANR